MSANADAKGLAQGTDSSTFALASGTKGTGPNAEGLARSADSSTSGDHGDSNIYLLRHFTCQSFVEGCKADGKLRPSEAATAVGVF